MGERGDRMVRGGGFEVANPEHLAKLNEGVEKWNEWRRSAAVRPNLSGANLSAVYLSQANLSGAYLSQADLREANLRESDLSGTYLGGANLSGANLSGANLKGVNLLQAKLIEANLKEANLREANLSGAAFDGANLSGSDLSGANLSGSDLSGANLSGANLSDVLLIAAQLLWSNLTSVILTGACIRDWNVNSATQLEGVICEYVYLSREWPEQEQKYLLTDRRPSDPNTIFAPGEFTKLFQKALSTVDLIFRNGVDWEALSLSLNKLRVESEGMELSVQSIENKNDGTFVVRINTPSDANKAEIEKYLKREYELAEKSLHDHYQQQLRLKDVEINGYRRENTNLLGIVNLLGSRPINAIAMAESQSNPNSITNNLQGANIANFANQVNDNARQQTNQNIYTSPEKQSLAEAAAEIQKLLKQLEQTNPTATESEQKAFVTAAIPATLRQRAVGALQAGGKATIEEFLDNPYVNVAIAIIEGWRDASST